VPELPDVEGFRQVAIRHAVGAPIVDVVVRSATIVRGVTAGGPRCGARRANEEWITRRRRRARSAQASWKSVIVI